jgi:general secretion pathway protein D
LATPSSSIPQLGGGSAVGSVNGGADLTGSYLGSAYAMGGMNAMMMPGSTQFGPRIMPNASDNSLLILATPEQYESVSRLLEQLDVPPRQVLIEAEILEVDLTGAFTGGVQAFLQSKGSAAPSTISGSATGATGRTLLGALDSSNTLTLTAGMLVGQTRQLFGLLTAQDQSTKAKVISRPRIMATDSIPASITVGEQVPTLSSQALTNATSGGTSIFANNVSNVSTGTTLSITARVNPSGIVTLLIDQQVSAPEAPSSSSAIQSPSFSNRQVKTQVTVQDGDMIAIGGIISESKTETSTGIPILHNLPWIGNAFGSKSTTKSRTELVIFLTPHVIYDTNSITEASDDLLQGMKRVRKMVREQ